VCPLSNVRLRVVDTIADHPLPDMLERGLIVTINSDDPAYFGGYVDDNFAAITAAFHLSVDQLALLATNGVRAAFLAPARRAELMAEIAIWRSAQTD
jgi:adenosine deaminase